MGSISFTRIANYVLVSSIVVWILGWLSVGAYYCHPNAEDFSLCVIPRDHGIIYAVVNLLTTYDGRYFTNLLHALNPLAFNWIAGYKLMPIVGILFFCTSFWFLLTTLLWSPNKYLLLLFSLLFTSIHFALAPSLPHDLYWMVSSFVYIYPWSFIFLWFGAYVRYIHSTDDKVAAPWFIVTIVALMCSIGINEMFLITNSFLLLVLLVWSWQKGNEALKNTMAIFLIGMASILFFITCPGISFRLDQNIPKGQSFFNAANCTQSVFDYFYSLFHFLKSGIVLCAGSLVLLYMDKLSFRYNFVIKKPSWKQLLLAATILLFVAYLMTLAYYIPMQTDTGYPSRIFNSVVVLFELLFVGLLPIALFQFDWFQRILLKLCGKQHQLGLLIIVTMLLLLIFTKNNISKLGEEYRSGVLSGFDADMRQRYLILASSKLGKNCVTVAVVDSLSYKPTTIYYGPDLLPNREKSYWNNAYELYFNIDEVKLTGDSLLF